MGEGNAKARIVFVGEAPGADEDRLGRPFVGKAGSNLDFILREVELNRADVYITNVAKCRPEGNAKPSIAQIRACTSKFLAAELSLIKPEIIILLGARPLMWFLDQVGGCAVGKHRNRNLADPQDEWQVYVTYHPAAAIYDEGKLPVIVSDIENILARASEKPKGYKVLYALYPRDEWAGRRILNGMPFCNELAVDVETTGFNMFDKDQRMRCINLCDEPGRAIVVPAKSQRQAVRDFLENPSSTKVMHNATFDMKWCWREGIKLAGPIFDTMVAAHLIDENIPNKGLEALAVEFLGVQPWKGTVAPKDMTWDELKIYGCKDADYTLRLKHKFEPMIHEFGLDRLFALCMDVSKTLAGMEMCGVAVDMRAHEKLTTQYAEMLDASYRKISTVAGNINLNSPKQVGAFLYEQLGLPALKKTKSGQPSADAEALDSLAEWPQNKHRDVIEALIEFRHASKIKGTFLDGLSKHIGSDGRIHPNFGQTTSVSRLSCRDPNMQQIPKQKGDHPIRKLYVSRWADRDGRITSVDYSQIELRWMAEISKDPVMLGAFADGVDIHALTAANFYHVDLKDVTEQQRANGKTVNFAIGYGAYPKKIARLTGLSERQSAAFIESWYSLYKGYSEWKEEIRTKLIRDGYVENLFGRKRRLTVLRPGTWDAESVMRKGINFPIQSGASDLLLLAMVTIDERFRQSGLRSRLILQVHDEIVIDTYPGELAAVREITSKVMLHPPLWKRFGFKLTVPLQIDITTGPNWLEQEEVRV